MVKEVKLVNGSVADLIAILSTYPPDTRIAVEGAGWTEVYLNFDTKKYLIFS